MRTCIQRRADASAPAPEPEALRIARGLALLSETALDAAFAADPAGMALLYAEALDACDAAQRSR